MHFELFIGIKLIYNKHLWNLIARRPHADRPYYYYYYLFFINS